MTDAEKVWEATPIDVWALWILAGLLVAWLLVSIPWNREAWRRVKFYVPNDKFPEVRRHIMLPYWIARWLDSWIN